MFVDIYVGGDHIPGFITCGSHLVMIQVIIVMRHLGIAMKFILICSLY